MGNPQHHLNLPILALQEPLDVIDGHRLPNLLSSL